MIVGWNEGGPSSLWVGALSGSAVTGSSNKAANIACDLNGDGVVDAADVQIAINQSLGKAPCKKADLDRDGACNVVDVQRVIVASRGGGCATGPR